jgi:hypothetical protein
MPLGSLEHGQAQAEVLELDAEHDGRRGLQEEEDAAGGQELIDGRGAEQRGDHEDVQDHAQDGNAGDAGHGRDRERRVVDAVDEVHAVHAENDQLGIADPDHVDDAEDEVEAEREEGEHAAQQYAIDERLEQVDVEEGHVNGAPCQTPRYAARIVSLSSSSAAPPAVRMLPALSR